MTPLSINTIDTTNLIGAAIVNAGDTPSARAWILSQLADNFILTASIIGKINCDILVPGLYEIVNARARFLLTKI